MDTIRAAVLTVILLVELGGGARAQDPQNLYDGLFRRLETDMQRQEIESRQRFDDGQRARAEAEQEAAYDGRRCALVGYSPGTPDYYQCIRDSAAYRRSGGTAESARRPRLECTTVGSGGIADTVCD